MKNPAAGGGGTRSTNFIRSRIGGGNTTARSIAQALSGSIRNGKSFLCRCPVATHGKGRGDRNRSLSIADGDDGKLLVRCFAGCDWLDVLAELRRRGLTDKPKTSRRRDPFADHHRATAAPVQGDEAASRRNCAFALRIWAPRQSARAARSPRLTYGVVPWNCPTKPQTRQFAFIPLAGLATSACPRWFALCVIFARMNPKRSIARP